MKKVALALSTCVVGIGVLIGCQKELSEKESNELAEKNLNELLVNIDKEDSSAVKKKIRGYDSELTDDKKLKKFINEWKEYDYKDNVTFVPLSKKDLSKDGKKYFNSISSNDVYLVSVPVKGKEQQKELKKVFIMEQKNDEFYLDEVKNYNETVNFIKKDKLQAYNMEDVTYKKPLTVDEKAEKSQKELKEAQEEARKALFDLALDVKSDDMAEALIKYYPDIVGEKKISIKVKSKDEFTLKTDTKDMTVMFGDAKGSWIVYDNDTDKMLLMSKNWGSKNAVTKSSSDSKSTSVNASASPTKSEEKKETPKGGPVFSKTQYDYKGIDSTITERTLAEVLNNQFAEQSQIVGNKMVSFQRNDEYSFNVQTNTRLIEIRFNENGEWAMFDYKTQKALLNGGAESIETEKAPVNNEQKVRDVLNNLFADSANHIYIGTKIESIEQSTSTIYYVTTDTSELQVDILVDGWNVYERNTGAKYFSSNGNDVRGN